MSPFRVLPAVGVLACLFLPPPPVRADNPIVALARKLEGKVDFPGFDNPKMTVQEAMDFLNERYKVPFDVNEAAFKADGVDDVMGSTLDRPIPRMKDVSLATVIRRVLARIPSQSHAAYVVRKHGIEITTERFLAAEFYALRSTADSDSGEEQPDLARVHSAPLVQAEFKNVPLEKALEQLSEQTGRNIVLDPRADDQAKENGKRTITATLINVPLDTAVRILADMNDLKPFRMDHVYYVTSKENADSLQAEDTAKNSPPGMGQPGGGIPGGLGALGAGGGIPGGLGALGTGGGLQGALGALGAPGGQGALGAIGLGGMYGFNGAGGALGAQGGLGGVPPLPAPPPAPGTGRTTKPMPPLGQASAPGKQPPAAKPPAESPKPPQPNEPKKPEPGKPSAMLPAPTDEPRYAIRSRNAGLLRRQ